MGAKKNRLNRLITGIKLAKQAFGAYKLQIFGLTVLGFLSGLLEGIGIGALVPLISFVTKEKVEGVDIITQTIEKVFLYFDIDFSLKYLLILICLLFVFKAIVLIFCNYIKVKINANYEIRTKNRLFNKTINANWPYLSKQKLGHLATILRTNVAASAGLLGVVGSVIMILTGLIVYTTVAINISLHITLFTLALGGVLFLFFKPFRHRAKIISYKVASLNKQVAHHINESILGVKTIKAILAGNKIIEIGKKYFNEYKKSKIKISLLDNITASLFEPISLIFICMAFAFAYKTPDFSLAVFVPTIYLIRRIFQYIQSMQGNLHDINTAVPYLKDVLKFENETTKNKEKIKGSKSFEFNNYLEFKNVSFSYNTDKTILANLNFKIKKGEMVGLIGPSGVGKTTIMDLMLRLLSPTQGKALVDGKDISKININQWRKNIGYVPQDIFLINDTIANNIRFYSNSINNKHIEQAAKKANIYNFIQTLPNKFSTIVGERGVFLSAGQRQRIVIARVLAKNPKFLILDEATSALDNESEIKIQKAIENLKGKVTVFIVAHRLSTVKNCDKLLVLEKGKIIEQGAPNKLLKDKKSYFYKVYNIREL